MTRNPGYPEPNPSAVNGPLLEAWGRGELMLQHCADCGHILFFPRELCPRCWSERLQWKRSPGHGRVVSYSCVYSHVTEPFATESPVVLAEIELAGGGGMLARVVNCIPENVRSGMPVALVPLPEAARYPLPTFQPPRDAS